METKYRLFDRLYAQASLINDELIDKSESIYADNSTKLFDALLMQLTSHAMSFTKNIMMNTIESLGLLFNVRCIIEIQALMNMLKAGDIDDTSLILFTHQYRLYEYTMYIKYPELDTKILQLDIIKKDYESTVAEYRYLLPDTEEKILQRILRSPLPFLKDSGIKYEQLVRKYTSPLMVKTYKLVSHIIHPHDFSKRKNAELFDFVEEIVTYLYKVLSRVEVIETRLFSYEKNVLLNCINRCNLGITASYRAQVKIMTKVIDVFNRDFEDDNFISNALFNIGPLLLDIGSDLVFGLSEQTKLKWKLIIEMVTAIDSIYFDFDRAPMILRLMRLHDAYMNLENTGEPSEKMIEMAYNEFRSLYTSDIEHKLFKSAFRLPLGFMMDADGVVPSLTKLVENKINQLYAEQTFTGDIPMSAMLRMLYDESQLLSHATGYMYNANTGAFCDSIVICQSVDYLILTLLTRLYVVFCAYETEEEAKKYSNVRNCLRNGIRDFKVEMEKKNSIYQTTRIDKSKYLNRQL